MSREASDLTKSIRRLCEETNFSITHAQARPKLAEMGFSIAPEPAEKTDAYKQWEHHATNRPKDQAELAAWYKATVKSAGLSQKLVESIMEEDGVHRAFNNERNNFDVTKYNYQRKVGSHASQKPEIANKVSPPAKHPRHEVDDAVPIKPKPKVILEEMTNLEHDVNSLKWLIEQGGRSSVEKKIAEFKSKAEELTAKLNEATSVLSKLSANVA